MEEYVHVRHNLAAEPEPTWGRSVLESLMREANDLGKMMKNPQAFIYVTE